MERDRIMDTALATLEDRGNVAIVSFKPRESLYVADSKAMIQFWNAFDDMKIQRKRVALFRMPNDFLSPKLVLGYAKAKRRYLDEITLSAQEALELSIVDQRRDLSSKTD